jgi:hypothetical protein
LRQVESENDFLRKQINVKDEQIKDLTERARETIISLAGYKKCLPRCWGDSPITPRTIHSGDNHSPRGTLAYNKCMEYGSPRQIGDILKDRNIEIIGADPVTRHCFTQVPNFILTKKDLSVGAKLAYAV